MSLIKEFSKCNKSQIDIMKFIIKNREEFYSLLNHLTWDDILNGRFVLTEDIVNSEMIPLIMEKADKYFKNIDIFFKDGAVFVYITGQFKGIPFKADYIISIDSFDFLPAKHMVTLKYKEKLSSVMNLDNKLLMKPIRGLIYAIMRKTFIEKGLGKQPGFSADKDKIVVNLDKIPQFNKLREKDTLNTLLQLSTMEYISCSDRKITFKVNINFPDDEQEMQSNEQGFYNVQEG